MSVVSRLPFPLVMSMCMRPMSALQVASGPVLVLWSLVMLNANALVIPKATLLNLEVRPVVLWETIRLSVPLGRATRFLPIVLVAVLLLGVSAKANVLFLL